MAENRRLTSGIRHRDDSDEATEATIHGEREFRPRAPGSLWIWVKRASFVELGVFIGLLVVWAIPGLEQPTFLFGMAHGIGYIALCLLLWVAILKREAPFWLFAATLTPVGPVGSVAGIEWIERRGSDGKIGESPGSSPS